MNSDLDKTLEQLEKEYWDDPDYDSHLVTTCHALRKKPLRSFTVEDLRIMIGQNFSLPYLIPLAINQLRANILAEGNCYEGDLLSSVLRSDRNYWKVHKDHWNLVCEMVKQNFPRLKKFDTIKEIRRLFDQFCDFHNNRQ